MQLCAQTKLGINKKQLKIGVALVVMRHCAFCCLKKLVDAAHQVEFVHPISSNVLVSWSQTQPHEFQHRCVCWFPPTLKGDSAALVFHGFPICPFLAPAKSLAEHCSLEFWKSRFLPYKLIISEDKGGDVGEKFERYFSDVPKAPKHDVFWPLAMAGALPAIAWHLVTAGAPVPGFNFTSLSPAPDFLLEPAHLIKARHDKSNLSFVG